MTVLISRNSLIAALGAAFVATAAAHHTPEHQRPAQTHAARPAPSTPAATARAVGTLIVGDAWVRATPPKAPVAGGFLSIRNTGKTTDRLLSATSPDAARVEIHTMKMEDGVMRMRKLENGLEIPPGGSATLVPGGEHLMFFSPTRRFVEGETVTATLRFERAGERTVRFAVRTAGGGHSH